MCGIVGIKANNNLAQKLFNILLSLQHRGQDSYGYADNIHIERYLGMITDPPESISDSVAIGHTRYRTSGKIDLYNCQPITDENITLVHNGQVHIEHEYSDSHGLLQFMLKNKQANLIDTIRYVIDNCAGSFFVIMLYENKIYAFKDKYGIRPGLYGISDDGDIVVASENCGFEDNNITFIKDIGPGCILEIANDINYYESNYSIKPCIFEYIYLAHPASTLYGLNVNKFRIKLAAAAVPLLQNDTIDVVCGVPNSSRIYALEVARLLNKPYFEPIVKKKRSFIMPTQEDRERYLKEKFTFLDHHFMHPNVLVVDDSIVRGSTAKVIVNKFKERDCHVTFLSCSPKVVNKNVFGINITSKTELISYNRTHREIENFLGCKVVYQNIQNLFKCSGFLDLEISKFID